MSCRCSVLHTCAAIENARPRRRPWFLTLVVLVAAMLGAAPAAVAGTLPAAACPTNLGSCSAGDVITRIVAVSIIGSDACNSPADSINLRITAEWATTANQRYDVGVFLSNDGGVVNNGASCSGAAPQVGDGDLNAYTDADTDLFLRLDGQATDTCGDVSNGAGPVAWTFDTSVKCNLTGGNLIIPSCRVWDQNGNAVCTSLTQAGTGSKCDCTNLVVTPAINPCATTICDDGNTCTDDSCAVINRTCSGGTNNGASCASDADCTGGGRCGGGAAQCVFTNDDTNTCGSSSSSDCDSPDTCSAGVCPCT